jgi:O-antigen/teichoic acid export membrane protein
VAEEPTKGDIDSELGALALSDSALRSVSAPRSIASHAAETLVLRVAVQIVAFVASILISRGLGPEGRGLYYLPVLAAATLSSLAKLGVEQANVFLFANRKVPVDSISGQNGLIAVVAGGSALIGLLVARSALPELFAETPVLLLGLAGLTIPFLLHTQFTAGLQNLQGQVTWQFRAALAASIVQVGALVVLVIMHRVDVTSVLVVNLLMTVVMWALVVNAPGARRTALLRWDPSLFGATLRHSLVLHVAMVLLFLHLRSDMFLVQGFLGPAALGQYSVAVILAETVLLMTDSLSIAILPRQMANSPKEAAAVAVRGAKVGLILALLAATFWAAFGRSMIELFFGTAFSPAYGPLVALLPGMVFLGIQRICGAPLLRLGRPFRFACVYAVAFAANVLLNVVLIPRLGLVGAGLASSSSYGLGAALLFAWTARTAGLSIASAVLPTRADWLFVRQALRRSGFVRDQSTADK